jgi:hypothetical protein
MFVTTPKEFADRANQLQKNKLEIGAVMSK